MTKKPNNSKADIDEKLAKKWKCTARTIRSWRTAGAPLAKPRLMTAWLASQRHVPPGTAKDLARTRRKQSVKALEDSEPLAGGAMQALLRLEFAESAAYSAYTYAIASGDFIVVKNAREAWLRIGGELRKFHLNLQESRQRMGEMVPRSDSENAVRKFVMLHESSIRWSLEMACSELVGWKTPNEVWAVLRNKIATAVVHSVASIQSQNLVPEYLTSAIVKQMGETVNESAITWFAYFQKVLLGLVEPMRTDPEVREKFFAVLADAYERAGLTPPEPPAAMSSDPDPADTE
jgi:hypothetical protein